MAKNVKGNDGKAARQNLTKRLTIILSTTFIILFIVTIVKIQKRKTDNPRFLRLKQAIPHPHLSHPDYMIMSDPYVLETPDEAKDNMGSQSDGDHHNNNNNNDYGSSSPMDKVLSGTVHLIEINILRNIFSSSSSEDYDGVVGVFCPIDWSIHKSDPSATPMFRDLIAKSNCNDHKFTLPLTPTLLSTLRTHDTTSETRTKNIPPTGFVFHESRCGSTLVANALAAFHPSSTRVYSESSPPLKALTACSHLDDDDDNKEDCTKASVSLFRDVIYLMGRTTTATTERHLFFKVQSIGSRSIGVMRAAFPTTPWIYVYREPVEVMMSHLDVPEDKMANCLRHKKNPPKDVVRILEGKGRSVGKKVGREEYCAAHLASLCQAALQQQKLSPNNTGQMVNYKTLPDSLATVILPDLFLHRALTDEETDAIYKISGRYSKGRGKRASDWVPDSERKEKRASREIREASETFMMKVYEEMEGVGGDEGMDDDNDEEEEEEEE